MSDKVESIAESAFDDIVARTAQSIETAINEHGGAAVELALMAYRVDAIKDILVGFSLLLFFFVSIVLSLKLPWKGWIHEDDTGLLDPFLMLAIFPIVFLVFVLIGALNLLTEIHVWVAAFGYPELMIATKALRAAGLL